MKHNPANASTSCSSWLAADFVEQGPIFTRPDAANPGCDEDLSAVDRRGTGIRYWMTSITTPRMASAQPSARQVFNCLAFVVRRRVGAMLIDPRRIRPSLSSGTHSSPRSTPDAAGDRVPRGDSAGAHDAQRPAGHRVDRASTGDLVTPSPTRLFRPGAAGRDSVPRDPFAAPTKDEPQETLPSSKRAPPTPRKPSATSCGRCSIRASSYSIGGSWRSIDRHATNHDLVSCPPRSRRQYLRGLAASVAGVSSPPGSRRWPNAASKQARHCVLLWMSGGPSQTDTFDLKPGHANGGRSRKSRPPLRDCGSASICRSWPARASGWPCSAA